MTFLPFIVSSSVMTLTALDFGFGLRRARRRWVSCCQGQANVQALRLGLAGFFARDHAVAADLHRRRQATLRSARRSGKAVGSYGRHQPALLDVAISRWRSATLASTRSRFRLARRVRGAVGESWLRKVRQRIVDLKLLPYPTARIPPAASISAARSVANGRGKCANPRQRHLDHLQER